MPVAPQAPIEGRRPRGSRATTIAIYVFAILEALGIGYLLWTY